LLAFLAPGAALACGPSNSAEAFFFLALMLSAPLALLGLEGVLVKLTNGVFVSELPTWFRAMAMTFTTGVVAVGLTVGAALSADHLYGLGVPLMLVQTAMLVSLVRTMRGTGRAQAFL